MRYLLFISLLLCSLILNAQVKFTSSLESGYEDRILSIYHDACPIAYQHLYNNFFTTLDASAGYKGFKAYTDIKTNIRPHSPVEYQPLQTQYRIGIRYRYKRVEFRYEHLCSHSIEQKLFHEGYDRVSVKIRLIER